MLKHFHFWYKQLTCFEEGGEEVATNLTNPSGNRSSILLAQIEKDSCLKLATKLYLAKANVVSVTNNKDCIDSTLYRWRQGQACDLIILDTEMKTSDGTPTAQRLRQAGYPEQVLGLATSTAKVEADDSYDAIIPLQTATERIIEIAKVAIDAKYNQKQIDACLFETPTEEKTSHKDDLIGQLEQALKNRDTNCASQLYREISSQYGLSSIANKLLLKKIGIYIQLGNLQLAADYLDGLKERAVQNTL